MCTRLSQYFINQVVISKKSSSDIYITKIDLTVLSEFTQLISLLKLCLNLFFAFQRIIDLIFFTVHFVPVYLSRLSLSILSFLSILSLSFCPFCPFCPNLSCLFVNFIYFCPFCPSCPFCLCCLFSVFLSRDKMDSATPPLYEYTTLLQHYDLKLGIKL